MPLPFCDFLLLAGRSGRTFRSPARRTAITRPAISRSPSSSRRPNRRWISAPSWSSTGANSAAPPARRAAVSPARSLADKLPLELGLDRRAGEMRVDVRIAFLAERFTDVIDAGRRRGELESALNHVLAMHGSS